MQPTTPPDLAILLAARQTLDQREAWSHAKIAEDERGRLVEVTSPKAVRWTLYGALLKAFDEQGRVSVTVGVPSENTEKCVTALAVVLGHLTAPLARFDYTASDAVYAINRDRQTTHERILAVLDQAIEAARPEPNRAAAPNEAIAA